MTTDDAIKDLEVIKSVVEWDYPMDWQISLDMAIDALRESQFVRCKDCKHWRDDNPRANGYHCCYRIHNAFPMKPDDFCSYGERKDT